MRISYRREMRHNYLIIDPEDLKLCEFECQMLEANALEGLLRFHKRYTDGSVRLFYDITSRQPLSRMLDGRCIRGGELRRLVLGIAGVLERMGVYLMSEQGLFLEPDYIYVEPESFSVWLCLLPGLERQFPEDCRNLLEYLLGKVDHQDQEGVVLAYGLYQESKKENYGLEDLLRQLHMQEKGGARCERSGTEAAAGSADSSWEMEEQSRIGQTVPWRREALPASEAQQEWGGAGESNPQRAGRRKENPRKGLLGKLSGWWRHLWKREGKEEMIEVPMEQMFSPKELPYEVQGTVWGQRERERYETYENERQSRQEADRRYERERNFGRQKQKMPSRTEAWEQEIRPGQDTVLLADLTERSSNRRLAALTAGLEDIEITYCPFVIGKQEQLVDYRLQKEAVSRLHARIDEEKGEYFLQDLNSTNGTWVAGRLLENNEKVLLQIGDEVSLAGLRYEFRA